MMATRLTDSELAASVRAGNRQRAQRQHERRRAAGLTQLNIWLTADTRAALATAAAANNETLSDAAERLLSAGLNATTRDTQPPDTPPAYTVLGDDERAALMAEVGALLDGGMTGNEIARRLNASGRRNSSGKPFIGANLLRDYRAWVKKTGGTDTTHD